MDRREAVLKYITKDQKGIEIGPWFNPLAPKKDGYRCLVLDVFDLATLQERARNDPNVPPHTWDRIEEVDLLGSSTHIDEIVAKQGGAGQFDYIVSSHNFEHLPNPIRFLQGCAKVLKPGGMISMAIPDRRACFDYYRPITKLSEWIEPYVENRDRPGYAQFFDNSTSLAFYDTGAGKTISFHRGVSPEKVSVPLVLEERFQQWMNLRNTNDETYLDTHCSVLTPSSFELLIRDCAYLGLVPFEIVEVFDSPGVEFYAHLRLNGSSEVAHPVDYERTRNELLRRILDEAAETSALDQRVAELRAEREGLEQELAQTSDSLQTEQLALAREVERAKLLEHDLHALKASTSWRITSPIRRVLGLLRRAS